MTSSSSPPRPGDHAPAPARCPECGTPCDHAAAGGCRGAVRKVGMDSAYHSCEGHCPVAAAPVTTRREEWVVQMAEYLFGSPKYPGRWRDMEAYDENMRRQPHTPETARSQYDYLVEEGTRYREPRGPENFRILHRVITIQEREVTGDE